MRTDFGGLAETARPLFWRTLHLPSAMRVAVLAPHPDDFDAIGITLRVLCENGNPIEVAVLTSGASGVDADFAAQLTTAGKAAVREQEQRASCRFFGLTPERVAFLRLAEDAAGHPEISAANLARLREYWEAHPPDLVCMPHGNDTNIGHQRAYRMVRQVATAGERPLGLLLNRDPKTIAMRHDVYTEFDDREAAWKGELLRFHQTQHQRNLRTRGYGFDERILRNNRETAAAAGRGAAYAEVFELEWYAGANAGSAGVV
ncbi:MAG: PIG-L family deacetylase [Candidatus Methylomirabilota bacterium]